MAATLHLTTAQLDAIVGHVSAVMPQEACGLLGGVEGVVKAVYPIPNVAPNPETSYFMEPRAQVSALSQIEARGWELTAIYHSHPPGGKGEPSPADIAQAYYPEAWTLIIVPGLNGRPISMKVFAIVDGNVSRVRLLVHPQTSPKA